MNEQEKGNSEGNGAIVKADAPQTAVAVVDFADVFIKTDPAGRMLRPIKADMKLFEKEKQIYKIKGDTYGITGDGYAKLNKVASITITTPPFVIVDGVQKPNPYIERNAKTRMIESVFVRKIGYGYSPVGNVVAIDKTLYYHVYAYFIQSVQAKMNRTKWDEQARKPGNVKEFPYAARTGTKDDRPTDVDTAKWAFFPTIDPLGIWINYADPAIEAVLDEFTQRQRFGDRIAQSIVERNILKAHPAIGLSSGKVVSDQRGTYMYATAYGFRTDESPREMEAAVAKGEAVVKADVIIDVEAEDEQAAIAETLETDHGAEAEAAAAAKLAQMTNSAKTSDGPLFKDGKK